MSKYNTVGGLRLKVSGRVSKEEIMKNFETVLNSLVRDHDLESFSGVNLYLNIYNTSGERLALISKNGTVSKGLDISSIESDFSWKKIGCSFMAVNEIERLEKEHAEEQARKDAIYREQYRLKRESEQREKDELNEFRKLICDEFEVKRISEVASSVGRIIDKKSILKYINESDIPSSGYVYRASLKNQNTGKVDSIRIYDSSFRLLSTSKL